jgi:uncharacterized protein YutE (UPF0331/DUF86 family)
MRLDLYQAETERIAAAQTALLEEAREALKSGRQLSALESNGVLHALQILIENAIGKAKQWLKTKREPVPVSAYDAFATLARVGYIASDDLPGWNALVGIRNRIVHDYMNIDLGRIHALVLEERYRFVTDSLMKRL